jgi:hypothetical protein
MTFIVKVQRPLVTNAAPGEEEALIYNRDRSLEVMFPMSQLAGAMGEDLKQFWHAHLEGTTLHLDKPAPWQEW